MANRTLTLEQIITRAASEDLTPYQVARLLNAKLQELGIDKAVRPQMIYNYDRNGMIVKGKKDTKAYTLDEAYDFIDRYVAKQLAKTVTEVEEDTEQDEATMADLVDEEA